MPLLIGSITSNSMQMRIGCLQGTSTSIDMVPDINRDRGNMNDIMIFNEIISNLGLIEIPLKGRNFTCSNMHSDPLLE
jgi:hypothetical protein